MNIREGEHGGRFSVSSARFAQALAKLSLVLVVASSCAGSDPAVGKRTELPDVPSFDHSSFSPIAIQAETLAHDPALARPFMLEIAHDKLWVLDASGKPALHVLNISDGRILHSLGRQGQGPGEFSAAFAISATGPTSSSVWVWDPDIQRITKMEPAPAATYAPLIMTVSGTPRLQRLASMGSAGFVAVGRTDSARFTLLDKDARFVKSVSGPILGSDEVPMEQRENASQQLRLCTRSSGEGFVVAFFTEARLDFHDANAELIKSADVPFKHEAQFVVDTLTKTLRHRYSRRAYVDCSATATALYALYSGKRYSDFKTEADNGEYLHVFDWSGKLTRVVSLSHPVRAIAVDAGDSTMFAVASDRLTILRFKLPR